MKNNLFLVFLSSIKYSALIILASALVSLVPIDIIYYFVNVQNSFNGQADVLPVTWLCVIYVIIAISYAVPVVLGTGTLSLAIGLYRKYLSQKTMGRFIGGMIGIVVFILGTLVFLKITGEQDLNNWGFFSTMTIWGTFIFAWLGHKIETLYVNADL